MKTDFENKVFFNVVQLLYFMIVYCRLVPEAVYILIPVDFGKLGLIYMRTSCRPMERMSRSVE